MAMNQPLVYLAGPISGLTYADSTTWRGYAREYLAGYGVLALSPMRGKQHLADAGVLHSGEYPESVLSTARGITARDRYDVCRSDVLLVNLLGATERVSIGTVMEIAWADLSRIPIVMAIEEADNPHIHAMVNEVVPFKVPSIFEALGVVRDVLGVGL